MPTPAFVCTPPQRCAGELLLRGFGAPVEKSAELLSVSVQPPSARWTAFVFEGAGAAGVSEQFVPDPKPTKSTTVAPNGQPLPESAVVALTRATLPALALMLTLPVASGAGKLWPQGEPEQLVPAASCTR